MPSTAVTIYSRRLRSAQKGNVCKCKVGSCTTCGSKCRRCMCACDGIEPSEALSRSRGGYRRQVNAIKTTREGINKNAKTNNSTITTNRIVTRNSLNKKLNKKRQRNSHFHKVGKIRSRNKRTKRVTQESDSGGSDDNHDDSTYVDDAEIATCYEESVQRKGKEANGKKISSKRDHSSAPTNRENDSRTEIDDSSGTKTVEDSEFVLDLETNDWSTLDDDVASTIAQKVMRSRKELPPKEQRFVMTNMENLLHPPIDNIENASIRTNEQKNTSKTRELEDLLRKLDLANHWVRVIPSFQIRETANDIQLAASKASFGRLTSLGVRMIDKCLRLLCPGPGYDNFRKDVFKKIEIQNKTNQSKTKARNPSQPRNRFERSPSEQLDSVNNTLSSWSNISMKRSVERRVIRAILNDSYLKHEVLRLKQTYGLKQGNGQPVRQARKDADELRHGRRLNIKTIIRKCKDESIVQKCVDFILSDSNVSSVAWGTKTVLLQSIGEITLPKLTRKKPIFKMFEIYRDSTENDSDQLKSTSFYAICNVLTSNDEAMLSSVDYVSGLLCNETCETLQEIIDQMIPNDQRDDCTKLVSVAKNFMKNQFKDHLLKDDECCFHGVEYALSRNTALKENIDDNGCKFPFYVCHHLESLLRELPIESDREDQRDDALTVISSIREKFKLFLSHQARCKCQSIAIDEAEEDIKRKCVESKGKIINALIIIDFKMKYEMKSTRETTVEHFGKRGIGWHGFAIIFYLLDNEGAPYKNIVYLDQILSETNMQNALTVVGLLETGIATIVSELPYIKEAVITSDNATCYQNHFVTFMMAIFNKKFSGQFFIKSFLHTETQDGKSLLDAHFATSNRHLLTFMKTWRTNRITRINTAQGLSYALSFNFGMKNSMVQLVEFDFCKLESLKVIFDKLIVKCGSYYSRANQITFTKTDNDNELWLDKQPSVYYLEQIKKTNFTFKVNAYSNVNPTVRFNVDVKDDKLTVDDGSPDSISTTSTLENETTLLQEEQTGVDQVNTHHPNIVQQLSDFSAFRKSKKVFVDKLEAVGALNLLGIASTTIERERFDSNDSDSDSDYDANESIADSDSEDDLDDYFLNNDNTTYGKPPETVYDVDSMITSTKLLRFLPLGTIRRKKNSKNTRSKISTKKMIKGVTDTAVRYAQKYIKQNDVFNTRDKLDPMVERAANFRMEPFENGWARRLGHGKTYGVSYIDQYEEELTEMFQVGSVNSSSKMSAGKMRESLLKTYPNRFSLPGETEIRQLIGKLSQKEKKERLSTNKKKSNRGRKPGKNNMSWYVVLREMIITDPNEKPEIIFKKLIDSFNDQFPEDLPILDDKPDKDKIKQTIARFKTKIKNDAKRTVFD